MFIKTPRLPPRDTLSPIKTDREPINTLDREGTTSDFRQREEDTLVSEAVSLWDSKTCADAARGGHLDVLKWARENGAPWNEQTCANAAAGGYLEVLKWAREHGARDIRTWVKAAAGSHFS